MILPLPLADLADAKATAVTTMYIPPKEASVLDPEMLELLGLDQDVIHKFTVTLSGQTAEPAQSAHDAAFGKQPGSGAANT